MPNLVTILGSHQTVWALWYTGAIDEDVRSWMTRRIERLILLHPESEYLPQFAHFFLREVPDLKALILDATRRAQKAGAKVKWFDGPVPASMTVASPRSDNGLIMLEIPLLFAPEEERPTFLIERGKSSALFLRLVNQYERIWFQSVEPTVE